MIVNADKIQCDSKVYFHTPTKLAKDLYLYPLCVGDYTYLPGYHLERENYPGYTLIYLEKGHLYGSSETNAFQLEEKQVLFLNGNLPHIYGTDVKSKVLWLHFDGPMAERFYHAILFENGNVITPNSSFHCEKLLREIFNTLDLDYAVNEPVISKYITDILNELLEPQQPKSDSSKKIQESIRYMNEHLEEEITIFDLASHAFLSSYHFIRLFKKVTGKTPHDYLIELRITHAKYYLKTTEKSIKEIAFLCGFSDESSFCNTFRKRIGSSPLQYRK